MVMKDIHEYSAGSIIYRLNNEKIEFLLAQSKLNKTWGFPKGHLEEGENEIQAAQREVYEEVGLKPDFDFNFKESITYKIVLLITYLDISFFSIYSCAFFKSSFNSS